MIISQEPTKAYRDGWDKIFNRKKAKSMEVSDFEIGDEVKVAHGVNKYWMGATGKVISITNVYVYFVPDRGQDCFREYYEKYGACFLPYQLEIIKKKKEVSMTTATITPPAKADISVAHLLSLLSIIEGFIDNEQMFTCWDITKALKAKGFVVPHNQVRDFVHGLNANDSVILDAWTRNTHTFTLRAGSMTAEVYAPSWLNVNDYDPYKIRDGSTPTITPRLPLNPITGAIQPRNTIIPSTTQKNTGSTITPGIPAVAKRTVQVTVKANLPAKRTVRDARGRLCIPNNFIRKLGLKSGDMAYIHKTGLGISVNAATLPGQKYIAALKVDKADNVRVTRNALEKASVNRFAYSMVISIDSLNTTVVATR